MLAESRLTVSGELRGLEAGACLREVGGRLYSDIHASRAFAVVDHEVAHVYVADESDITETAAVLAELDGVADVIGVDDSRWELTLRRGAVRRPHGAVVVEVIST